MVKIITEIFCVLMLLCTARSATTPKREWNRGLEIERPSSFYYELTPTRWLDRHLVNMTKEFCTDATLKMRSVEHVQAPYKLTKGYELGIIAAGLVEKFKFMIKIYRYYTNDKAFKNNAHAIHDLFDGYSNIQGVYNEMLAETVLYNKVLAYHLKKDARDFAKAKIIARKYKVSVQALLELQSRGITFEDAGLVERRSMQADTKLPVNVGKLPEDYRPRDLLQEDPMAKNVNIWSPKKNNNSQEEEYKKKLRYKTWAAGWKGYDGETEGVYIADTIARLGSANDSDFLLKELKGFV